MTGPANDNENINESQQQKKCPPKQHKRRDKMQQVRREGRSKSTLLPKQHQDWHEARNIWNWQAQAQFIVLCQSAPNWLVLPPSIFFHFLLKRDWGMAIGPFFAFAIFPDSRNLDLFLAAALAGVLCGVFKHVFRSPRPFWIVPEVYLKEGVEEMSWATPSAHAAIQGAISAVLVYYSPTSATSWILNAIALIFCMFSRLYLAVHWPQDVCVGAILGIVSGVAICSSGMHQALLDFAAEYHPYGGLLYLSVGIAYVAVTALAVQLLDLISDKDPVPHECVIRYKVGVARALRILENPSEARDECPKGLRSSFFAFSQAHRDNDDDDLDDDSVATTDDLQDSSSDGVLPVECSESMSLDASSSLKDMEEGVEQQNVGCDQLDDASRRLSVQLTASDLSREVCRLRNSRADALTSHFFMELEGIDEEEDEELKASKEEGLFFRKDVAFNPDSKERFWYNAVNVLGAYCGAALYSCAVDKENVEFVARLRWLAAIYAAGISFSIIVYARTILRSMLTRKQFKATRTFVYMFLGFFTYGIFPLSYVALMNSH